MCGRYNLGLDVEIKDLEEIIREAQRKVDEETRDKLKTHGEVFPTNIAPVISRDGAQAMHWGMPLFDGKYPNVINSRDDKLEINGEYVRILTAGLRCLVPILFYYEWNKDKRRYAFWLKNKPLMYAAGISKTEGVPMPSFSIITTMPNKDVKLIHERMPLLLSKDAQKEWLVPDADVQDVLRVGIKDVEYQEDDNTPKQMKLF